MITDKSYFAAMGRIAQALDALKTVETAGEEAVGIVKSVASAVWDDVSSMHTYVNNVVLPIVNNQLSAATQKVQELEKTVDELKNNG